jgi:hypothetical protein
MKFACPNCGQHLAAEQEMAGRQIACPTCEAMLTVPAEKPRVNKLSLVCFAIVIGIVLAAAGVTLLSGNQGKARTVLSKIFRQSKPTASFEKDVTPLLNQYCYSCHGNGKHKGDLALDAYKSTADILKDRARWEIVAHHLRSREMPPEGKPQPTENQRDLIVGWIESEVFKTDCDHPDPGRVTMRRLNRVEYNNTIHDLVGIDFQPADDFPADDSGYGFDNIGDVLSLPPILLEKYLAAAEKILDAAIVINPVSEKKVYPANALEIGYNSKRLGNGWVGLNSAEEDDVAIQYRTPLEGEYILRARAYAQAEDAVPMKLSFRVDNKEFKLVEVTAKKEAPQIYEVTLKATKGKRRFSVVVPRLKLNPDDKQVSRQKGTVFVERLELEGPLPGPERKLPSSHTRIFTRQPTPATKADCAREIIANFATRAFRRPATASEVSRLMKLFELADKNKEPFETAIEVALEAVLVSPHFLFRNELQPEPNNPQAVFPVDDFALASRLSYFLWSSMPDEELFALAGKKALRKNLEPQVKRMLADPKARALVENFAGQWLQIRNLKTSTPDWFQYPEFDDELRNAMETETEMFFESIMRQDRSLLDFLNADYTFVNERLAKHYGLTEVKGSEFRRVSLKSTPRRGLLTQASVLTLTSNPTRTSPVKRGKWVLENILGAPPPPPPPDVPELKEGKELTGSLRQRMEQHRENPLCASCHARMDPIGFGLENFNGIGGWRGKDGAAPIDPSGTLVSGENFQGAAELTRIFVDKKKDEFVRCLTEKMLTYAIGRGTEYYDRCAIEKISRDVARNNYKFSSLVLELTKSVPFQMRRGDNSRATKTVAQGVAD